MSDYKLGAVETRFAELIWENEPLPSGELVKLCGAALCWKKPTTYTVLRKLCEKGLFRNKNGMVTSILSREEYAAHQSGQFVDEAFHGSLPAFVAAFTRERQLSQQEIDELQRLIDENRR